MIKKGLIITENDRRSILSMYGLLTEQGNTPKIIPEITVTGKVMTLQTPDNPVSTPIECVVIKLFGVNEDGSINKSDPTNGETKNDLKDGSFTLVVKNIEEGKYKLLIKPFDSTYVISDIDINITETKLLYDLGVIKNDKILSDLKEVKIPIKMATNLNITVLKDDNKISNYELTISPSDNPEKILYNSLIQTNEVNLTFLKSGTLYSDLKKDQEYDPEIINGNDGSFFKGSEKKQILIKVKNRQIGEIEKKIDIFTENVNFRMQESVENNKLKLFYIDGKLDDQFFIKRGKQNNIIINANPNLELKIMDESNGEVLPNTEVLDITNNKTYTTDKDGIIIIQNAKDEKYKFKINNKNYFSVIKTFSLDLGKDKKEEIYLQRFDVSGELLDEYKDNYKFTYGRGRTDINYETALIKSKVDAVNKFIDENQKNYSGIEKLGDTDIDLNYEIVYSKRKKSEDDFNFIIIKVKNKDIKNFLTNYGLKQNIQIEDQPLVFETDGIIETLSYSYREGKNVVVFVGLDDDERTKQMIKDIEDNRSLKKDISKNSRSIFVDVDNTNGSDFDYLIEKGIDIKSYPTLLVLKPTDLKGNFKVLKNYKYSVIQNTINKMNSINT
jgi:hypothetical protein